MVKQLEGGAMLNEKERKLLTLALDPAAQPGEIETAGRKLIESLRARDARIDEFLPTKEIIPIRRQGPDWGSVRCPFKKYKGMRIRDIPLDYLMFIRDWILDDCEREERFSAFLKAVEGFLD